MGLAADLVQVIHSIWRQPNNEPVVKTIVERMKPFYNWEYRVTPTQWPRKRQLLTPEKIGLALFTTFWEMTKLDRWPGHTKTRIFESNAPSLPYTDQIGTVDLNNMPRAEDTSSANNVTALEVSLWPKRWLNCFQQLHRLGLPEKPYDLVTAGPMFPPKPEVHKYSFNCGNPGAADRVDFFIYPTANAGGVSQLRWDDVMLILQNWILRVASGTDTGSSTQIYRAGKLVAEVSIYVQPTPAGS